MGARSVQERRGLHAATSSGRHVGGAASVRGDGRRPRPGGRLQHSIRGLHVVENASQVSRAPSRSHFGARPPPTGACAAAPTTSAREHALVCVYQADPCRTRATSAPLPPSPPSTSLTELPQLFAAVIRSQLSVGHGVRSASGSRGQAVRRVGRRMCKGGCAWFGQPPSKQPKPRASCS